MELDISDIRKITESLNRMNEEINRMDANNGKDLDEEFEEGDSDYGQEDSLDGAIDDEDDECGPVDGGDVIDDALEAMMKVLVDAGYDEDSAESATFDALEALMTDGHLEDMPDISDPAENKAQWVANAMPLVRSQLKEMGLDF